MFEEYVLRCRLDEIMREKKIATYEEVSAITGNSYNAVRRVAHQETKGIDFESLKRFCLGLGISPNDLFSIDTRTAVYGEILCPKCGAAMKRTSGTAYLWICTKDSTHEYVEDFEDHDEE